MIKFPQIHLATSVVNRILNIADGIEMQAAMSQPSTPELGQQGAQLDAALAQPVGEVPAIDDPAVADAANSVAAVDAL